MFGQNQVDTLEECRNALQKSCNRISDTLLINNRILMMNRFNEAVIREKSLKLRIIRLPIRSNRSTGMCPVDRGQHESGLAMDVFPVFHSFAYYEPLLKKYFDHVERCGNLIHLAMDGFAEGVV